MRQVSARTAPRAVTNVTASCERDRILYKLWGGCAAATGSYARLASAVPRPIHLAWWL